MKQFVAKNGHVWNFPDSETHFQTILDINPEYQYKIKQKILSNSTQFDFTHVVDIGANVGLWTLWFHKIGAKRIDCFEPIAENYACLQENIKGYPNTILHPIALGESEGSITLYTSIANSNTGTASIYADSNLTVPHMVECKTLDSYNFQPTFLKLDIQGAELLVLRGSINTLNTYRPGILLECEDQDRFPIRFLEKLGYVVVANTTSDFLMKYTL